MHISAVDVHRSNTLSGGSLHNLISRALSGRTFSSPATRGIGRFAPSAPGYDPMAFQAIFPAQWAGRAKPRAERSDALGCNEMTTMRPNGARETLPASRPSGTITVAPNGNVYKDQG